MGQEFKIKVGDFEGPLELLLDLVEKKKLHVSQVSLSQVADEYIDYLKSSPGIPMAEMANFILVASTLMLIKSMTLLPGLPITSEEKDDIENLERRLKILQQIRQLAGGVIKKNFGRRIMFARSERRVEPIFTPSEELRQADWLKILRDTMASLPKLETLPTTMVKKIVSLEEMINRLAERVTSALKLKFSEFVREHQKERVAVIVSFLGMLELVKQGAIEARQDKHFDDIQMESRSTGVPRYVI